MLPPEAGSSFHRLKVESATSTPSRVTVLTIEAPPITGPRYVLSGQVRSEGVEGTAYLEMWSYFPGGGRSFTRTLGDEGPMMKLRGTAGWRAFALPFDATGAPHPARLVVNVVLDGRGTVFLSGLTLGDQAQADLSVPGGALNRLSGVAGGIAGSVVGAAGALIGVLTALGRARRFVIALAVSLAAAGAVLCLTGIAAIGSGRPPAVSSPAPARGVPRLGAPARVASDNQAAIPGGRAARHAGARRRVTWHSQLQDVPRQRFCDTPCACES